jgi:dipeptidase E
MPQTTHILLGGGGSAEDEHPILAHFATAVAGGRVLYLPIAMLEPLPQHLAWLKSALAPLGVQHIDMWTTLDGHQPFELAAYAGVFIGGGNTYWLLHQVRTAGFADPLRQYAALGHAIYGGSAGAILLGADIATCAHMDHDFVGTADTAGLDLLDGHAVWCHYQASDDELCAAYVRRKGRALYLLAETGGLWRRGPHDFVSLGRTPAILLSPSDTA